MHQPSIETVPYLKSYLASQPEVRSDTRLTQLQAFSANPLTEVYLLFLQSSLSLFTNLNKVLQCNYPNIHVMLQKNNSFVRKLFGRFKAEVLTSGDLTSVDIYDHDNFLPCDWFPHPMYQ